MKKELLRLCSILSTVFFLFSGCANGITSPDSTVKPDERALFVAADIQPKVEAVFACSSTILNPRTYEALLFQEPRTYAVLENGAVYFWGKKIDVTKPADEYENQQLPAPFSLPGVDLKDNIQDIQFAGNATFILLKNGDLYSFGQNEICGILGDGTTKDRNEAKRILQNIKQIIILCSSCDASFVKTHPGYQESCDYHTVIALTKDGDVYAWGYNGQARFYNGTYESSSWPQKVSSLSHIQRLYRDPLDNRPFYWYAITESNEFLRSNDTEFGRGTTLSVFFTANGNIVSFSVLSDAVLVLYEDGTLWKHYGNGNKTQIFNHVKQLEGHANPYVLMENGDLFQYNRESREFEQKLNDIVSIAAERFTDAEGRAWEWRSDSGRWAKTVYKSPASFYQGRHYLNKSGVLYSYGSTKDYYGFSVPLGIQLNPGEECIDVPVQVLFPVGWNQK